MRISLKFVGDAFTFYRPVSGNRGVHLLLMDNTNPMRLTEGSPGSGSSMVLHLPIVIVRGVPLRYGQIKEILKVPTSR